MTGIWREGDLFQFDRYCIIQQIGGGGFGLTYLAEDCYLHRQVVIKTPHQVFRADQDYEKFVRRFQREGQLLAKISHPNVVRVFDVIAIEKMLCIVMEYVQGETLNERIRRSGPLSEDEALQYFRKLAEALQQVHSQGLIHCDVHPGNILLRPDNEPVLIDFGSAKTLQPGTLTVTTTINDGFSPYEQRQGNPQPTLDVYGLAATLYFAVTGQKPQAAMDRKLFGDKLQSPQQLRTDLSYWLSQAILQGMALEAADRSPSMQAWLDLLDPPQVEVPPLPPTIEVPLLPTSGFFQASLQGGKKLYKKTLKQHSPKRSFPWISLNLLLYGYIPIGILIGLDPVSSSVRVLTVVWAWIWAMTWVWAGTGFGNGTWVVTWAWAGVFAGVLTGVLAWAGNGSWAWALTGAGAGAGVWVSVSIGTWTTLENKRHLNICKSFSTAYIVLPLIGGVIPGYFTTIGIWGGFGIGFLVFFQQSMIVVGIGSSIEVLTARYSQKVIFLIYGLFSTLGLALGGVIGWWLKLSGIVLK